MKKKNNTFTVNQLLFVQAHLGNKTSKFNPLTKSFLFGSRHGVHFFDLKQITPYLKRVLFLLTKATTNHQIILFVGAHPFVSVLIKFLANNTKQHSISRKWVGGTLTNWLKIRPYVSFLYRTNIMQIRKKFVLRTEKKIEQKIIQYLKMKYLLSGIERMPTIPNLIVVLEKDVNTYPLMESFKLMIPIISIVNTGQNSLGISYPIFGNDYLFDSLFFWGNLMLQAIRNGVLQKRLLFLKTSLPFILSLKQKRANFKTMPLQAKKKSLYQTKFKANFDKFMLEKCNVFFRAYRGYRALALKRILRKSAYILSISKKPISKSL
jgi:small subunit ribosomal protein S2